MNRSRAVPGVARTRSTVATTTMNGVCRCTTISACSSFWCSKVRRPGCPGSRFWKSAMPTAVPLPTLTPKPSPVLAQPTLNDCWQTPRLCAIGARSRRRSAMPAPLSMSSRNSAALTAISGALSTASGLLLVISSAVAHDLYYRVLRPEATDKQRLLVVRQFQRKVL